MSIAERLNTIKSNLPTQVTLIAVSKTKPIKSVEEAYAAGHIDFGENYVQELVEKHEQLPKNIHWHFIGHLQSNKVKYIAAFVYLIHGVDSLSLLKEINKQAKKNNRVISCLLQVHIAQEETKFGFSPEEVIELCDSKDILSLENIELVGLMAMASNTEDTMQIEHEFAQVKNVFDTLTTRSVPNLKMRILSCGMSGDYELAIKNGSTMIRIGSSIFGVR
jgi:PLP dependent protein